MKTKRQGKTHYNRTFKQAVVLYAERESNREAEKKYGISETNIRRWRKLKTELFGVYLLSSFCFIKKYYTVTFFADLKLSYFRFDATTTTHVT